MIIVGKESDGTPIVLGDVTNGTILRMDYRKAKKIAEEMPLENLEAFLDDINIAKKEKNIVLRIINKAYDFLDPDPLLIAYRDVLKQRKEL